MQDTVCCGCSVVCDDVAVEMKKAELHSLGLCKLGHEYCSSIRSKTRLKKALVKSESGKVKQTSLQIAYEKTISLLSNSKKPLFLGWSNSPSEVSTLGIKLAKRLKGVFESTAHFEYGRLLDYGFAGGEAGRVKLEEVRDFADFIVYWGVNPAESHHRHASRYTVFPRGKNIPEGRESRVIAVLDIRDTESMQLANHQLILDPTIGDNQFLEALITEIEGTQKTLPDKIGGVPAIEFLSFAKQIQEAEYIAIFYGNGVLHSQNNSQTLSQLAKLTSLLNQNQRQCKTLPMIAYCNTTGSVKTSLDQTKFPFSIDFTSKPHSRHDSVFEGIKEKEFDVALIVGWDALSMFPSPITKALQEIPLIVLSTQPTLTTREATVVFPTALTGAETGGTVYRMDGTPVSLKPFAKPPSQIPSEEQVLKHLLKLVK